MTTSLPQNLEIKVVDNRPVGGHAHVQFGHPNCGQRFNFTADEARAIARALKRAAKQITRDDEPQPVQTVATFQLEEQ